MNKNVAVAIVALLLIFGGGFFAYSVLFSEEEVQSTAPVAQVPVEIPQTAPADAAPGEPNEIRATMVEGTVERRAGETEWAAIAEGDTMEITDEIRSGTGAAATFTVGEDTSVDVSQNTEFGFVEISDAVSKIRLDDGRIAASSEGRKVRVEVKNSDAVAETEDGAFAVLTEGEGNVTVAASRGNVDLSAQGETVQLTEGKQSIVLANKAPTRPTEIPSSLFLKVRKPRADRKLETTVVEGTSTPGSVIHVAGERLAVGEDGKFKKRVALVVGSKDIKVTVEDAAGRKESTSVRIITPNANTKGKVEW